jgi:hypothetical protein
MNKHANQTPENKTESAANVVVQKQAGSNPVFQFADNRPAAAAQKKMQEAINNSPRVKQLSAYRAMADNYTSGKTVQRMKIAYGDRELNTDTVPTSILGELSGDDLMTIIRAIEEHPHLSTDEEIRAKHVLRVAKTEFLKKDPRKGGLPALGLPPGGWGVPASALGNAYLNARAATRPKIVNKHNVKGPEGVRNCSVVAAAAVLGQDSEELYSKLQPANEDGSGDPVATSLAFLGKEGEKYNNSSGGVKDEYAAEIIGISLDAHKKKRAKETGQPEKDFVREWIQMKADVGVPNEQIQKNMQVFVKSNLGWGVHVRTGGNPAAMLPIREGIVAMKRSPPGTQFIVFVKGETGKKIQPHYIYANNLGGNIHFHDYQPFGTGSEAASAASGRPAHPHNIDEPTPPPFQSGGTFTKLAFMAFEVNSGHMIEYLTKLYRP